MSDRSSFRLTALAALLTVLCLVGAACGDSTDPASGESGEKLAPLADGFPDETITVWNIFEPGHTDDLFNKAFVEAAQKYSPVRIISDTKTSAGPTLQYGILPFLESRPQAAEGYDMVATAFGGATLRPWTVEQLADHNPSELNPVGIMVQAPFVFVVPTGSQFESLADVQEFAKSNPGELNAVASSTGSSLHSSLSVWSAEAGLGADDIRFVPTNGSGESLQVLRGGGADIGVLTYLAGVDQQVKVLAATGEQRFDGLPDVPTVEEATGFALNVGSERGYAVLESVPAEHVDWLFRLLEKVANDPEFQEQQKGFSIRIKDAKAVRDYQQEIIDTWIPILEERNLTTGLHK